MKKLFTIFATFAMLCAVGCEEKGNDNVDPNDKTEQPGDKPGDAYISINKEVLTLSPDGESVDVKVYSNYEWTLTNNCDWVTTSISGGEASDAGTTVTLTANLTYDDREGTITFSCGKAKKVLVVSQSFKEAIIADENNVFNVPAEGGNVILDYQTTVECEVIIPEEAQGWISLASGQTRGLVSGSATLNIALNNKGVERSAVVKVVKDGDHGGLYAEYTITQERNMDYVILYTTTDGNTVSPNSFYYLANTYEDGVGMLAFDGSNVTTIGSSAFYECTSLTSVTIGNGVTSIRDWAFYNCTSLTSVTIGNGVTSIGRYTFEGCTSLTSITIPDSVTSIGAFAFSDCSSLTSVTIGNGVTEIGGMAFYNCTSLTSITIPDSVTEIGDGAFENCTSLMSVTIGNGVTSIGAFAFYDCTSLTSVTIPDSVTEIGSYAFRGCYFAISEFMNNSSINSEENNYWGALMYEIIQEDGLCINGSSAVDYRPNTTSITIPDSVTSIGNSAFRGCESLTNVTIPDSVTSIGEGAFYYCTSLTSINIPDSVTSIGDNVFSDCSSLTSVTIGNGVTSIGYQAFRGCKSLTNVTIPDSVTSIGYQAFYNCLSLTSITIPDSVTSIGNSAFYGCTSLASVYCKATTPPTGGFSMFGSNASGRKIYVPTESVEAYKTANYWSLYDDDIVGYDF